MKSIVRKPALTASLLALTVGATPVAFGASSTSGSNSSRSQPVKRVITADWIRGQSADDILGQDVRSTTGQDLGEVQDLLVDTDSGRVVYALISTGGVLGMGEIVHVVPFSAFQDDGIVRDGALIVDLHGQNWDSVPTNRHHSLASLGEAQRGSEIYRSFGRDWKKDLPELANSSTATSPLRRVADISGADVVQAGRDVGTIEDVVVDFKNRRAMALLDPDDDFTGTDQKFAIGFKQLSASPSDRDRYTTTLTPTDFRKAAPIADNDQNMSAAWDGAAPYVWNYGYHTGYGYTDTTNVDNERTPIAEVRNALRADASLSEAMDDVHLRRRGDKLIVSGRVPSVSIKDQIADKAGDVAKGWDIENHLLVRAPAE